MPFDTKKILYYRNQEKKKFDLLFLIIIASGTKYKLYESLNMPLDVIGTEDLAVVKIYFLQINHIKNLYEIKLWKKCVNYCLDVIKRRKKKIIDCLYLKKQLQLSYINI